MHFSMTFQATAYHWGMETPGPARDQQRSQTWRRRLRSRLNAVIL